MGDWRPSGIGQVGRCEENSARPQKKTSNGIEFPYREVLNVTPTIKCPFKQHK